MSRSLAITPPRHFGAVNWLGLWSHYRRGIYRFFDFVWESVGGPCVFTLMFLVVFVVAFGSENQIAPGLTYATFIAPGLIMFSICYTAFEMAAFSVLDDKQNRTIEDLLAAPLTPLEVMAGYVLSAASSALLTGTVVGVLVAVFVELPIPGLLPLVGFALLGCLLFVLMAHASRAQSCSSSAAESNGRGKTVVSSRMRSAPAISSSTTKPPPTE